MKKFKWDILLIVILFIIAILSGFLIHNIFNNQGDYVQVLIDNKVVDEYSLSKDGVYDINYDDYINQLTIKDGVAFINNANCRDLICVNYGQISKDGESIICLPHKLVVRVVSQDNANLDAISN